MDLITEHKRVAKVEKSISGAQNKGFAERLMLVEAALVWTGFVNETTSGCTSDDVWLIKSYSGQQKDKQANPGCRLTLGISI